MAFNCLARIFGAGWNKTAGRRQPRRDYCFVKLQKRNQNKTHRLMWHRLQSVSLLRHRLKSVPLFQPRSSRATCSTILRNSRKRSSSFELSRDLLALMTQSYCCPSASNSLRLRRKTSRNKRRARLRSTDFPIAFVEAVTPSRCTGKSFLRKKAAIKRPS